MTLHVIIPEPSATTRRAQRRYAQGVLMATFALGVLVGFVADRYLSDLRHSVHDEITAAKWAQFEALKADYQERFKKQLRTTKAQAQVIVTQVDQRREREQQAPTQEDPAP